jgi:hypothetical protein
MELDYPRRDTSVIVQKISVDEVPLLKVDRPNSIAAVQSPMFD